MKIKQTKIKVILYKTDDFTPTMKNTGELLKVVNELKLPGVKTWSVMPIPRSALQYAAVFWYAGITLINTAHIEIVQKSACAIIIGKQHECYQTALSTLGLERLNIRRQNLSLKFSKNAFKFDKYASWFVNDKK